MQTGNQITGRPCLGSWVSLRPGLDEREPADVRRAGRQADATPSRSRRSPAGSGRRATCPGEHAGVSFRSGGDPILYINNPPGVPADVRRKTLDGLKALNEMNYKQRGRPGDPHPDPAVRAGVPDAVERPRADRHRERARIDLRPLRRGREEAGHASPTRPCWRGGWSSAACGSSRSTTTTGTTTATSPAACPSQCKDVDQACYGLIQDLKQRGLLDDTLVIWGGEFGRTIYSQGGLSHENYGRDHHPRCFTGDGWRAGPGNAAC